MNKTNCTVKNPFSLSKLLFHIHFVYLPFIVVMYLFNVFNIICLHSLSLKCLAFLLLFFCSICFINVERLICFGIVQARSQG